MMINSNYTLLFFLFFPFYLFAQSTYEAATIYLNDGSSQDGFVNRTDFKRIGEEVYFKTTLEAESIKHTINSIKGFRFKEDNLEFVKTDFHLLNTNEKGEEVKVPLQRFSKILLESSSINFYKVELKRNEYDSQILGSEDYLYIITKGKNTLQLDVLKGEKNGSALVASERYKGKLKYIFSECPSINTGDVSFRDNSILNIIRKYYDCIGIQEEIKINYSNRKLIIEQRFGIFGSIAEVRFESHSYYGLGYATTLFSPEVSTKLGATIGAGLTYQKYFSETFRQDLSQVHFKIDLLLDWRVLNHEKHKLTLQTGLSWFPHISTQPQNLTSTPFPIFSYALLPINLVYDYQSFRFYAGLSRTVDLGIAYRLK